MNLLSTPLRKFAVVSLATVAALAAYLIRTAETSRFAAATSAAHPVPSHAGNPPPTPKSPPVRASADTGNPPNDPPRRIVFRHTGLDDHFGRLASARPEAPTDRQFVGSLACEAIHVAKTRGICLTADRGVMTTYAAVILDAQWRRLFSIPLNGAPSRCRVSGDGRIAAVTVFVSGHSYTSLDFSTQTLLLDATRGTVLADLEEFDVFESGKLFKEKDFNFWGVTFAPDSSLYYATLSSGGRHYLVRGTVSGRRLDIIHENVECPSVSPSGTQIAYKKRLPRAGRIEWQFHVLDLATSREQPLPERRSVDDQLEWLDESTLLYALPSGATGSSASTDIWRISSDGLGKPVLFFANGYSPAVLR